MTLFEHFSKYDIHISRYRILFGLQAYDKVSADVLLPNEYGRVLLFYVVLLQFVFQSKKTKETEYASIFNIVILLPCLIILKIKAFIVYLLYFLKFHLLSSKTIQK